VRSKYASGPARPPPTPSALYVTSVSLRYACWHVAGLPPRLPSPPLRKTRRFALRPPLSAAASSLSGRAGPFSGPPIESGRIDRSTTKGAQYIVARLHSGARRGHGRGNENQGEGREEARERREERRRGLGGVEVEVGWGGGEEGKRRGCRGVAASCNESHKRKRSHVILNEGPLRASPSVLTEPPPLFGGPPPPPLAVLLVIISPSPSLFIGVSHPFLSPRVPFGVPPLYSPPCPPPRVPRRLGSLFIFISFGLVCGSRLGTVITEYPPLTSSTLVVLSLGLLPLVYHPLIPPPVPPPPLRHSLLSFANAPGRRRHDDV
jgi:hypothetical protein